MRIYGRSFLISNGINVANELYSHCLRPHDNGDAAWFGLRERSA
jgi:hypothetical protein